MYRGNCKQDIFSIQNQIIISFGFITSLTMYFSISQTSVEHQIRILCTNEMK